MPFDSLNISGQQYTTKATGKIGKGTIQTLAFPDNQGTAESPHYMVLFINELVGGKYASAVKSRLSGDSPAMYSPHSATTYKTLKDGTAYVKGLAAKAGDAWSALKNIGQSGSQSVNRNPHEGAGYGNNEEGSLSEFLSPEYARTNVCIALPIPETVNTSINTVWTTANNELLGNLIAIGSATLNDVSAEGAKTATNNAAAAYGSYRFAKGLANLFGDSGNMITKAVNNPRKETLFNDLMPRRFSFQWTLYPRSPSESKAVWDIIQMLKYHALPEYDTTTHGFYLMFPNTFDIEFHSHNKRNHWLPKTSTCALEKIDINYTPAGTSAMFRENKSGQYPDGSAPVGVVIGLDFVELELIYRNRIDPEGDYSFNQHQGPDGGTF